MSDEPESLVLRLLQEIRRDLADVKTDVASVKTDTGIIRETQMVHGLQLRNHSDMFAEVERILRGVADRLRQAR